MAISNSTAAATLKSKILTTVSASVVAKVTTLITIAAATGTLGVTIGLAKSGNMPAILVVKEPAKPATPTPVPTPTPTPAPVAAPSFEAGINVASSVYYNTERTFANLAMGASAWLDPDAGWGAMVASKLNAHGYPLTSGALPINVPQPVWSGKDTAIKCTWQGSGTVRVDGDRIGEVYGDHMLTVTWRGRTSQA
ncbi:MAG TPA: hypothetical protein VM900_00825, partial [Sphingomonas sp.]|nr:hypothetical protein [Sphingomonas sp.]